jgi:hypothetical protein
MGLRSQESRLLESLSPPPRELGKASSAMGGAVDPQMRLRSNAAVRSVKGAGILISWLSSSRTYSLKSF